MEPVQQLAQALVGVLASGQVLAPKPFAYHDRDPCLCPGLCLDPCHGDLGLGLDLCPEFSLSLSPSPFLALSVGKSASLELLSALLSSLPVPGLPSLVLLVCMVYPWLSLREAPELPLELAASSALPLEGVLWRPQRAAGRLG